MEDKKQEKINEQEKNQEQKQDVLELIENSLGDVSGGGKLHYKGGDIDENRHWYNR